MRRLLISRVSAIVLFVVSTLWDAGATYLTLGHKLHLDGNPFSRGMDWKGLGVLHAVLGILLVAFFILTYEKQHLLWPEEKVDFVGFLRRCLKENVSFRLTLQAKEKVYVAQVAFWTLIFAHTFAALITSSPLLGGPSFLDAARFFSETAVRYSQNATTLLIVAAAFICGHYPLYQVFLSDREASQ